MGVGQRPLWFLLAVVMCSTVFLAGIYVEHTRMFPYSWLRTVYKTLVVNLRLWEEQNETEDVVRDDAAGDQRCARMSDEMKDELTRARGDYAGLRRVHCLFAGVSSDDGVAAGVEFVAGRQLEEPVLVKGEFGTFLDRCPTPAGCLAVEYSSNGGVSRVWPFLHDEIVAANVVSASSHPYEHKLDWSFLSGVRNFHISSHLGDDLLVVFEFSLTFPYGGGVARIAPDGMPRWYRKDYSHHWPHVVDEDLLLVPSMRIFRSSILYHVGQGHRRRTVELKCEREMIFEDQVNILNGNGELLEQLSVLDAIAQSRHADRLVDVEGCDPTHLNFVHVLGEDFAGVSGLVRGDLVVSLRNLSAFGILDKDDGRLKRLVRGGFHYQHAVRHLDKARFVMFDNWGTDGVHGPSRVTMVDLATGEEATLYPTDTTPANLRLGRTRHKGQLDISSDGRRALVTDLPNARALEIRLADGEVLNVFHSVYDMSRLAGVVPESIAQNVWLFEIHDVHYADRRTPAGGGG